jgi:UrcA family protein
MSWSVNLSEPVSQAIVFSAVLAIHVVSETGVTKETTTMLLTRLLLAAGALGFALAASSANAQDDQYGNPNYGPPPSYGPAYGPPEEITVFGPRRHVERGDLGAAIQDVAISRPVRFDDLDLRTDWGARELRNRIEYTARVMCQRLDAMYPISADNSPPCYRTAVDQAIYQADAAISQARGYPYSE